MAEKFHYQGFSTPNGTIVPDDVFDVLAPQLGEAELRVLLYIVRRTFGFKKESDDISLKQLVEGIRTRDGRTLDRGSGLSKSAAARGVKGLVEKGVITTIRNRSAEKGDEPTTYALRWRHDPVSSKETRGVPPGKHGGVLLQDTQQTVLQETALHINSSSKDRQSLIRTSKRKGGVGGDRARATAIVYAQAADGPAAVGEILARRPPPSARGRAPKPTPWIEQVVTDWSSEFHDEGHTRSNLTRAMRLYKASGLSEEAFVSKLYEARSIVKMRGNITKTAKDLAPLKNRAPYWFAVVEDLLGMRDKTAEEQPSRPEAGR